MANLAIQRHKVVKIHPLAILTLTQLANETLVDDVNPTQKPLPELAGLYGLNGKCQQKLADLLRQQKPIIKDDDYYRLGLTDDEQKALLELCIRAKTNPHRLETMSQTGLLDVATHLEQSNFE